MPNLLAEALELQDDPNGYWFEFARGGLDDVPQVRGDNLVIPGRAGEFWMPKEYAGMLVTLRGSVHGTPGGGAPESYLARMAALLAVFSPLAEAITLTIHPTAQGVGGGLGAGETATLDVEFLRVTGMPAMADRWRNIDLECRAIGDPPLWVIESP